MERAYLVIVGIIALAVAISLIGLYFITQPQPVDIIGTIFNSFSDFFGWLSRILGLAPTSTVQERKIVSGGSIGG